MYELLFLSETIEGVPSEVRIFAFGELDTAKGRFSFTAQSGQQVLKAWEKRARDMGWDYEHQTFAEPPIEAPASAWCRLELRADGLWAVDIQWTARARKHLEEKEYRFYSPSLAFNPKTREITDLLNVALTNFPAMHGQKPLVELGMRARLTAGFGAVAERVGRALDQKLDDWACVVDVWPDFVVYRREGRYWRRDYSVTKSGEIIIADEAIEVEPVYQPVQKKELEMNDKKGGEGTDSLKSELADVRRELAELRASERARELLAEHAGKISPAMRPHLAKLAATDPDGFKALVSTLPDLPAGSLQAPPPLPQSAVLTGCDQAVMAQLNLSDEDVKKFGG